MLNNRDFNNFFFNGFNDLVNFYNDWVIHNQFNDLRDLNDLLIVSFNLVNSWNFSGNGDKFFNHIRDLDDLLNCGINWHYFFSDHFNFLDDFIHIRNNPLNFLDHLPHDWLLHHLNNFLNLHLFKSNLDNFFDFLGYLDNLFNFSFNRNKLFDDSVNWDRNLDWDCEWSVNLYNFFNLNDFRDESLDLDLSGNFDFDFDNFFAFLLDDLNSIDSSFDGNNFLDNSFDDFINFVINVFDNLNFFYSLLNDGDLD